MSHPREKVWRTIFVIPIIDQALNIATVFISWGLAPMSHAAGMVFYLPRKCAAPTIPPNYTPRALKAQSLYQTANMIMETPRHDVTLSLCVRQASHNAKNKLP